MADSATGAVGASNSEARNRVRAKLEPGEKVLWIGKPIPRIDPCAWFLGIFFGVLLLGAGIEATFRPETMERASSNRVNIRFSGLGKGFVNLPSSDISDVLAAFEKLTGEP